MSEFQYIDWLRQRTPPDSRVLLGPGDDCAALSLPSETLLVTTDMLLEGVHFRLDELSPRLVGRKALAVNLSDIAAMAGRPVAAVISVGLPRKSTREVGEEVYLGIRELADGFETAIVGGDTNSWTGGLVVSVTLLGTAISGRPVCRSGAKPGDWLLVTGPLGGSILGKHATFTPRVHEARALHDIVHLNAMIDISDGLAADANHIGEESGCGIVLIAQNIPISEGGTHMNDQKSPLDHALSDGEDFELLFSVSADEGKRLVKEQPIDGISLVKVGMCIAEPGLFLEEDKRRRPILPTGFVHSFSK